MYPSPNLDMYFLTNSAVFFLTESEHLRSSMRRHCFSSFCRMYWVSCKGENIVIFLKIGTFISNQKNVKRTGLNVQYKFSTRNLQVCVGLTLNFQFYYVVYLPNQLCQIPINHSYSITGQTVEQIHLIKLFKSSQTQ